MLGVDFCALLTDIKHSQASKRKKKNRRRRRSPQESTAVTLSRQQGEPPSAQSPVLPWFYCRGGGKCARFSCIESLTVLL